MIDFDDSAPASSETTGGGGNDLSGLFSYLAQPAQAPAQAQYQPQQQQQQPPSTYAPTPLFYNNNSGGGMNAFVQSTPNSMTPHRQISGTPPASIALPQSKPGSQRSTPVPTAPTPNYFGNAVARGPVGGMGVNRGMGSGLSMSMPVINAGGAPPAMNLSGALSGMSLNGGSNMGGMGSVMFQPPSTVVPQQQPQQATTTTTTTTSSAPAPPPPASGTDPFADLAGLF